MSDHILEQVCESAVERIDRQHLHGVRGDADVVAFVAGASCGLRIAGQGDAGANVAIFLALEVVNGGAEAVRQKLAELREKADA